MSSVLSAAEKDEFSRIGGQMSRWMDHVLGPSFQHYHPADSWRPAVNLCEHDSHFCIIVELAGMKATEIDLRAEQGVLVLAGERALPGEAEAEGSVRLHLMEIDHGHFERAIELPENVDIDAIEAFYRNGYLWVRIPKTV